MKPWVSLETKKKGISMIKASTQKTYYKAEMVWEEVLAEWIHLIYFQCLWVEVAHHLVSQEEVNEVEDAEGAVVTRFKDSTLVVSLVKVKALLLSLVELTNNSLLYC